MQKASLIARILYKTLKKSGFSRKIFDKLVNRPKRNTNHVAARNVSRKLTATEDIVYGHKLLTVSKTAEPQKHIFFLHGGAYCAEAGKGHLKVMERLAIRYNFRVSIYDYPLAPENTVHNTLKATVEAYNHIVCSFPDDKFFLLGDSAGGGLALTLLQTLRDEANLRFPEKTALVSPWADVSMTNPYIPKYTATDPLLSQSGLIQCAKLYAAGLDLKNPLVSPMYGNHERLGQLKIWVSTFELLYPDSLLLNDKINSAGGSSCQLVQQAGMIHDWIVLPVKESNTTIDEIAGFFR